MNIAYLLHSYLCCGGNRIVFEHANRLAARGHRIACVALTAEHDGSWFRLNDGVRLESYGDFERWLPGLDHAVATYHATVPAVLALPAGVAKHYFVQTDERNFYDPLDPGRRACENTYRHPFLHLLTEARWIEEWLRREFSRTAGLVENGIDFEEIFPDPDPALKSGRPVVLVEGNAGAPKKGVREALEAIRGLPVEKWLLCNDTGDLPDYVRGFDRIFNLPPRASIRRVISSADVIVKASHFEGCPLPHMEAMTCGTPLVTTDCSGVDEHCRDGENALVVPVGDVPALRKAVERLLGDEPFRKALGERARRYALERFPWDPRIDRLEEIFRAASAIDETSVPPTRLPSPLPSLGAGIIRIPRLPARWRAAGSAAGGGGDGIWMESLADLAAENEDLRERLAALEEKMARLEAGVVRIAAYHGKLVRIARILGLDGLVKAKRLISRTLRPPRGRVFWTQELIAGDRIVQEFEAGESFREVLVKLGTHARRNGCTLRLSLSAGAPDAPPIRTVEADGLHVLDNGHHRFGFPTIHPPGTTRYFLRLDWPDAVPGAGISCGARQSDEAPGFFLFNRTRMKGRIDFRRA